MYRRKNAMAPVSTGLLMCAVTGLVMSFSGTLVMAAPPALPSGLGGEPEAPSETAPALPSGLEMPASKADSLPQSETETVGAGDEESLASFGFSPWSYSGFLEARAGGRTRSDPDQSDTTLEELRFNSTLDYQHSDFSARLSADVRVDDEAESGNLRLDQGKGWLDLREAWVVWPANDWLDVKAGRQILTWGVGDQLFINDLFPKDWNSFFLGRDQSYLKAPSDALKLAFYGDAVNIDVVWVPVFDADRYIDGERISFFNPIAGDVTGAANGIPVDRPDQDEFALRAYRNLSGTELAAYVYSGHWKSPNSIDPARGEFLFPALNVYGASIRGNLAGGVGSAEIGRYDSRDDKSGDKAFIANSESRLLLGYERELVPNLTGGLQYYVERMEDFDAYTQSLEAIGATQGIRDKYRQVWTLRLTWLTFNQSLSASLFTYYSPSDDDAYVQPKIQYKASDQWQLTVGANQFVGEEQDTFFGQFERTSNIYGAVRYSF